MLIRIAIVDDQPEARELLRQDLLVRAPAGTSIACFDSSESFLSGFVPGDDSLIFPDICMKGMNGIEAAERVRKRSARCLIVFLTSSREYAFDAFPIHPFDYLVKPYQTSQLEHVLSGAIRLISLQTFAELEAMLQGDERFLPCNRGVLVNMDEALKLDGDSIILMNGMRFPIRQRNRLEMVNRFSEYQIRRMKRG